MLLGLGLDWVLCGLSWYSVCQYILLEELMTYVEGHWGGGSTLLGGWFRGVWVGVDDCGVVRAVLAKLVLGFRQLVSQGGVSAS